MRLFVAVWPPPAVIDQLARIERPPRRGVRWTTEDQWHVTLRFLGQVDLEELDRVKAALEPLEAAGRTGPVTAAAGPAVIRFGPSILCIPVTGVEELAGAVGRLTAGIGAPPGGRRFRGHLTIARTKEVGRRLTVTVPFAASWPVEEVTLVASHLHPDGARYQVLSRVALRPARS